MIASTRRNRSCGASFTSRRCAPATPIFRTYPMHRDVVATTTEILRDLDFDLPWQDIDRDVRNILRSLAEARPEIRRPAGLDVEILESIFYRNKGAYLVGSLRYAGSAWPVVLPILVDEEQAVRRHADLRRRRTVRGVQLHALVLHGRRAVSVCARRLSECTVAGQEAFRAVCRDRYAQARQDEFYRGFLTHLARSKDQFVIAPGHQRHGDDGVHAAVVSDRLQDHQRRVRAAEGHHARAGQSRSTTSSRRTIASVAWPTRRNSFVLRCRARASAPELIEELNAVAASSITLNDDLVIIEHVYTERLMTPLNLYLEAANDGAAARSARRVRQRDQATRRRKHLPRRHAAEELRRDAARPRGVLRLRRDLLSDRRATSARCPHRTTRTRSSRRNPGSASARSDVFPEEFRRFLFGRPASNACSPRCTASCSIRATGRGCSARSAPAK